MQKALIPATFLTTAFPAGKTILQHENYLYVIREQGNAVTKISHLHSLFFGYEALQLQPDNIVQQHPNNDPTYYSSYE
jgi:hypothetical protein